ncbi:hypothetical protein NHX12_029578 [Muraenolepis orangiensis]|uniref:Uncharacterized protein n=1 Tax=Muraenolepis orangiensis TaxID=630683 RepID=A0A9Q0E884_9TELE|nr:hypothetical protein NHX12_029578 [Muraenolepis orangiensis]
MRGLGANRHRHLSDSCDPALGHPEAMYPHQTGTLPRSPYLLSAAPVDHYGTMDPHLYPSAGPLSLPPDCMLPLNNQLTNSSTFPRLHYDNSYDQSDFPRRGTTSGGSARGRWAPPWGWGRWAPPWGWGWRAGGRPSSPAARPPSRTTGTRPRTRTPRPPTC